LSFIKLPVLKVGDEHFGYYQQYEKRSSVEERVVFEHQSEGIISHQQEDVLQLMGKSQLVKSANYQIITRFSN
jgi:hypothetical protein